ncbi:translation elongation factor Ts [Thioflexithrix psekupsensis]|uniref:Elongation factor Ts n=1 Tax=Thioflexithrix psekupsensis TaxID=1570016 RepID=A0A251XCB5_9GAMM|nr:translation elongation factor Ts [Thioflexithrix psekupsensis]OUD15730.1 translation elongation factor Ts [Thioflexithrix psekupsensis]
MSITAALVKELRERTGAGMMECKKALVESNGDIEAAIEAMRKSGQAKAAKKAGRIAAEGLIVVQGDSQRTAMVEVNCETDFVSKGDDFQGFCQLVVDKVLQDNPASLDDLLATQVNGKSIEEIRNDMIAKIGENISVRRFICSTADAGGVLGVYLHGTRIGVLLKMQGGNEALARDVAMHVAASRPLCVSADQVPAEVLDKEREIFTAQSAESGKPADIISKMVEGRLEVTLLGQPFVKDPDQSVEKLLKAQKATVLQFERFEVGEGIEKKTENFADEVMQQVKGHT